MPENKPGYKTTEFWLALIAVLMGALMTSGLIPADSGWEKVVGLVATVLGALGYTVNRSMVKSNELKLKAVDVLKGP